VDGFRWCAGAQTLDREKRIVLVDSLNPAVATLGLALSGTSTQQSELVRQGLAA
jgi:hypothetical protein